MARLQFARRARRDIGELLDRSHEQFGSAARRRYEALVNTALHDIADDALRSGSVERIMLGRHVRLYHLRHSRERARTEDGIVQAPRHILAYRMVDSDIVVVLRVLHDAMDLARHLDAPPQ
jgi:toxin ParE1/3/4